LRRARKRSSIDCGSRTSQGCARILVFADASSLLMRRRADWWRAVRIRLHPSAARARAMASPMPRVAPVTTAFWFCKGRGRDLAELDGGKVGLSPIPVSNILRPDQRQSEQLHWSFPHKGAQDDQRLLTFQGKGSKAATAVSAPHHRPLFKCHWDAGGLGRGTRSGFRSSRGNTQAWTK
jgi:hypothetical protein